MPNWSDPAVIEDNSKVFSIILLFILGLYGWEFLTTIWVEASFIIQPRRKWRIEHLSYFACRYSFLVVTIILVALYNLTHEVNCTALGLSAQVLGNISIGTATLNILYRAWAISRRYGHLLTIILAIAEVGHWAILIWNVFTVHSEWVLTVKKCNITLTSRPALVTLYVYTMLFDFVILLICLTGLYKHRPEAGAVQKQGQFRRLLRRQGIYYFLFSFTANVFPFVFMLLDLNPVMNTITTVPAACVTTIASCRAVIWLTGGGTDGSRLSDRSDFPLTPSAPGSGRHRPSGRKPRNRELEVATGDVGLPSETFARTRRNDESERAVRSSIDDPSDFKTPATPPHYNQTSATHPVVLTLSDKGENQAGASGSTASSTHRPDTSSSFLATKGYYPYDGRGRRAISPDSRPSTGATGGEDRPVRERYRIVMSGGE